MLQRMKDKHGTVCYVINVGYEPYLIPVEDYKLAKELEISTPTIKKHIIKGTKHFKKYIDDYKRKQSMKRLAIEDREREERRQAKLEAKQRKEQERLQMIENAKCRDPYWFDNTWNQMFKGWS